MQEAEKETAAARQAALEASEKAAASYTLELGKLKVSTLFRHPIPTPNSGTQFIRLPNYSHNNCPLLARRLQEDVRLRDEAAHEARRSSEEAARTHTLEVGKLKVSTLDTQSTDTQSTDTQSANPICYLPRFLPPYPLPPLRMT